MPSRRPRSPAARRLQHVGAAALTALAATAMPESVPPAMTTARVADGASRGTAAGADPMHQPAPPAVDRRHGDARVTGGSTDLGELPVDVRPTQRVGPRTFGPTAGEAVDITNATAWHAGGIDGGGVKIGVIDFFDVSSFWNVAEHGPLPIAGVNARCFDFGSDCTDDFFDGIDLGGEEHGIAVVEVIRDMAPGAEIYIGQATTISDYQALVDWFVANDVDIVNRSLGSRYDGPGDGRGPLGDVVASATARGLLWVNSAGNNAAGNYYRHPVRLVGDRVAFGPTGDDTFLPFAGCIALGGIRWANDWDTPATERSDYDAFIWESPTGSPAAGTIVASSTFDQRAGAPPIEGIANDRCPPSGSSLYLELRWRGGEPSGDVIEVLDYGSGIVAFTQAPYSAAVSVVDSQEPAVLAVGAIDPAASGTIGDYSSQGPTNDGRIVPHLAAPAGFQNTVVGWFAGTSAAAAVVSGGAALLQDAGLAADGTSLADLVRHLALDRGDPGPDHLYGHGEFRLPDPPSDDGVDETPSRFVALDVPMRALDTRATTAVGPPGLVGEVRRGEILDLPVLGANGVPATDVTAVAVNIVSANPDRPSYVQALPTLQATVAGYSNLNLDAPGQTRANFAIVPVGETGTISLYSVADGHLVVDVLGWFERATGPVDAGRFVELDTPERLVDTRIDAPAGPLTPNATRTVPMPAGLAVDDVEALVVTVTAAASTAAGWIQAYPADRSDVIGTTSTVNTTPTGAVANTAIVPVGASGIAVTGFFAADGTSHVIVDAIGYITSASAAAATSGQYRAVRPGRAFDSRSTNPVLDQQVVIVNASDAPGVTVPDTAAAVVWNMAVIGANRPGFLRTWAADRPEPSTSSLNWAGPAETRASAVISAVDGGRSRVRFEDGTADLSAPIGHALADVFGYFTM